MTALLPCSLIQAYMDDAREDGAQLMLDSTVISGSLEGALQYSILNPHIRLSLSVSLVESQMMYDSVLLDPLIPSFSKNLSTSYAGFSLLYEPICRDSRYSRLPHLQ